jgi:hypothetical protein
MMKLVKMKTPSGQLMSRIPETDVDYHMKNGWKMVNKTVGTPKPKKELKAEVQVDLDLDLNEENE